MKNPIIAFGAITGNPTREEIRTALALYKANGVDAFIIYPRDGCDVPYMSEAFLDMCRTYIEYAAEIGMDIILYDEYNWPSGSCKGAVQRENEEFCSRYLTTDGEIRVNRNAVDILNPQAVDCFIEKTHEVYAQHFGPYFGNVIQGIFTDEPSFAHFMRDDGIAKEKALYPYNRDAAEEYAAVTGRSLIEDVRNDRDEPNVYYRILGKRFRSVYVDRLAAWCSCHGIYLTGHLLGEDSLQVACKSSGNTITALRGFTMPGIDETDTNTDIRTTHLFTFGSLQAALRNTGREGFCELSAIGPTDLPLSKLEQIIWFVSMFGVSRYTLALSPLDMRGNAQKTGYFFTSNYMQPWFCGLRDLGQSAETAAAFAKKECRAEVGVIAPFGACADEKGGEISEKMQELLLLLTRKQYQWILLTEDETPRDLPILNVAEEGFCVEEAVASLPAKRDLVTETTGEVAEEIFLRHFTDGTSVLLDLRDSGEERELCYQGQTFTLSGRGHVILPARAVKRKTLGFCKEPFRVELDRKNTLRCNFKQDGDAFTFTCLRDFEDITLLVRNYAFDGRLTLDGQPVRADRPTDALIRGMSELYRETEPMFLARGIHTVRLDRRLRSEPFFPSCLICGTFSANDRDELRELEHTAGFGRLDHDVFHQYAGRVRFLFETVMPEAADLRISCYHTYARLSIGGEDLGGRFSDYVWSIPEKYAGKKVTLCVDEYTSIGPMLGRTGDVTAEGDGEWWVSIKKLFPGRYEAIGIESVEFVEKTE